MFSGQQNMGGTSAGASGKVFLLLEKRASSLFHPEHDNIQKRETHLFLGLQVQARAKIAQRGRQSRVNGGEANMKPRRASQELFHLWVSLSDIIKVLNVKPVGNRLSVICSQKYPN